MLSEIDQLIDAAAKETGLSDFGKDDFLEPLERLTQALVSQARLNDFGLLRANMTIQSGLVNRLRIQDHLLKNPLVCDEEIKSPIFIVGLPRTGTTALHHLLNQDSNNRTLRIWEAQDPIPPPQTKTYYNDPRIAEQREKISLTETFLPGFKSMHLIDAEEPDECYMLLNRSFMSVEYSALFHIPDYADWLYEQLVSRGSYEYHRVQLQILQSRHPGRWVLKAPFHQLGLAEILRLYPDAIIVQTHRPLAAVVASGCSFSALLRRSGSDHVDLQEIGRDWMAMLSAYSNRFEKSRAELEDQHSSQFVDLMYSEFVADPLAGVRKIYAASGVTLESESERRMNDWLAKNPQGKHGQHVYQLSDYGISIDEVKNLFDEYLIRYDLTID